MNKESFIFMRFALLAESGETGWKIAKTLGKSNYQQYKAEIFSIERLKFRLWTVENLALPSIIRNVAHLDPDSGPRLNFCILTSEELPGWAADELSRIASAYPYSSIKFCGPAPHYPKEFVKEEVLRSLSDRNVATIFSTTALDDDDLLGDTAMRRISRYLGKAFVGHAVTLANGVVGHFDSDLSQYVRFNELYLPMSSVGLTYINEFRPDRGFTEGRYVTMTGLGGHLHVDAKVPLITEARRPGWIRTMHSGNDVKLGVLDHWSLDLPRASEAYVKQCVDLDALPMTAACRNELSARPSGSVRHSKKTRASVTISRLRRRLKGADERIEVDADEG